MDEEKNTKKLNSRKFAVWFIWTLLAAAIVVMGFIRDSEQLIIKLSEYYFFISAIYLGVNVTQKGIQAFKDVNKTNEEN